jgi:hypothetical protein
MLLKVLAYSTACQCSQASFATVVGGAGGGPMHRAHDAVDEDHAEVQPVYHNYWYGYAARGWKKKRWTKRAGSIPDYGMCIARRASAKRHMGNT